MKKILFFFIINPILFFGTYAMDRYVHYGHQQKKSHREYRTTFQRQNNSCNFSDAEKDVISDDISNIDSEDEVPSSKDKKMLFMPRGKPVLTTKRASSKIIPQPFVLPQHLQNQEKTKSFMTKALFANSSDVRIYAMETYGYLGEIKKLILKVVVESDRKTFLSKVQEIETNLQKVLMKNFLETSDKEIAKLCVEHSVALLKEVQSAL